MHKYENLSLDQIAAQFAGPIPLIAKKITRRSSYAQAGISISTAADPVIHPAPSSAILRTQSLAETPVPPTARLLRHSRSDASATIRLRGNFTHQPLSDHDDSSVSQAGLEAMDAITEIEDWEEQRAPIQSTAFRIRSSHRNHPDTTESFEATSRGSSIRTDTAGRAERLATLIKAKAPQVTVSPMIEAAGPWTRQASTIDRSHAHDILVRNRTEHPKYKDPAAGLAGLLKSKKAKQKALDDQNWAFTEEELNRGLQEVLESGYVVVAEFFLDQVADVHYRRDVAKQKLSGFRKKTAKPVMTNYINIAASTGNVDMLRLLASRGASSTDLVEALATAVTQNLPGVVETLLQYDVDPNSISGTIFQSAITTQKPTIVKLLLRARKRILKSLLSECLPTAVEQGQIEVVSLLVLYGDDVNNKRALALRKGVQSQRSDLLLAIMKGNPTSESASLVFKDAFLPNSSITVEEKYL